MSKKMVFLKFVMLGAICRDLGAETNDQQLITYYASMIPENRIPANVKNAAMVFLTYFFKPSSKAFKWMLPPTEIKPDEPCDPEPSK